MADCDPFQQSYVPLNLEDSSGIISGLCFSIYMAASAIYTNIQPLGLSTMHSLLYIPIIRSCSTGHTYSSEDLLCLINTLIEHYYVPQTKWGTSWFWSVSYYYYYSYSSSAKILSGPFLGQYCTEINKTSQTCKAH